MKYFISRLGGFLDCSWGKAFESQSNYTKFGCRLLDMAPIPPGMWSRALLLPKLEDNPVLPKQKSTKREDSQVEGENGKSRKSGGGDSGDTEIDCACDEVGGQEEGQWVLGDGAVEAWAGIQNVLLLKVHVWRRTTDSNDHYLRYKFGFGGEEEGAGDFLSNLILKLSDAFFDLIDLEVFFGSCSSATYTRRRSRIAKPETQDWIFLPQCKITD